MVTRLTGYACHCTDCQTSSGSAFTLSMTVNRDNIEMIQDKVGRSKHRSDLICATLSTMCLNDDTSQLMYGKIQEGSK